MVEPRIIKKYPNRRLYDTTLSCYITLNDVRELVIAESPFKVVDRQTGEDITRSILLQIIMEQESGGQPLFSADVLSQFIRNYSISTHQGFTEFMEHSMSTFKAQQKAVSEQMHKVLKGTPLDTWLKMSEQNVQMWNQVQRSFIKSLTPNSTPLSPNDKK